MKLRTTVPALILIFGPVSSVLAQPPVQEQPHHDSSVGHHRNQLQQLQNEPNRLRIPPSFFDFGFDPFDGIVPLRDMPAGIDTVVRRPPLDIPPVPIPIELVELSLVGVDSIEVTPTPSDKELAEKVLEKLE